MVFTAEWVNQCAQASPARAKKHIATVVTLGLSPLVMR